MDEAFWIFFFFVIVACSCFFSFFSSTSRNNAMLCIKRKNTIKKKKRRHKNKLHRIAWDFSFSQKKRNDCGDFSVRFSQKPLSPCCFVFPSLACRVSFPSVTTQNPAAIFVVEDGRPSLRGHGKQHYPPHRFYNALINPGVVASLV